IQSMLRRIFLSRNRRAGKVCQWMSHKLGIHASVTIERFFKWKNHQRFIYIFPQQPHSPLPPCPELRADIIDDRHCALLHLASNAPVESWRINNDREIGTTPASFSNQLVKQTPDFWKMAENFRDADDRKLLGIHNQIASGGAHFLASN